ncbi:MAG: hypothetical protein CMF86_02305 [Candidatus Marinimicrobia bacterium]|jgi:hypothetical protein|nr:hypothetical protein [Candidatus Neomarinimicrobiota bacterium]MBD73448.1 hypothetical protein [Candidatus Neomarinimicrobiota bacterium]|tara:strand:- start:3733 stop:4200 length:468 start_codon:yes stop_codon:yes gene_type:complete
MDSLGYWLFLLILYMLSFMMKKRKQKAARQKLEGDEENGWQTTDFVKGIFADFVDKGEEELDEAVFTELEEELEEELGKPEFHEPPQEIPLEESHLPKKDLSIIDEHRTIGTIAHREIKKVIFRSIFFQNQGDVRMAMIYKEIMDKPRALRRSIR